VDAMVSSMAFMVSLAVSGTAVHQPMSEGMYMTAGLWRLASTNSWTIPASMVYNTET
jgi:hypothetical protein